MTLDVCVLRPSVPPAVTEARTYPVAPGSVTVQAGILVGEITEMQVTERVEQSAGRREDSVPGRPVAADRARGIADRSDLFVHHVRP